ncbi:hypothetical protein HN803_07085 [candidate division WWE3 bacterium]|nr:hypothetical protein [candidate division WWE3 bacterium]
MKLKSAYRQALNEGGGGGHMSHPFDDNNLTFNDFEKMIRGLLDGHITNHGKVTEKLDGQNLMFTWKDGKLLAARNKGQMKNHGDNALDIAGVKKMFAGRGELETSFTQAVVDLQAAIKKLSEAQRLKIFGNGQNFMNIEVMYVPTTNVIPYGKNMLVFHGANRYDEAGIAVGEVEGSAAILGGMIKQINADIQKTFTLQGPQNVTIPKDAKFNAQQAKFIKRLTVLRTKFGLKKTARIVKYHEAWWEDRIDKSFKSAKLPASTLKGLLRRWVYGDKSYALTSKNIDDPKVLEKAKKIDKEDYNKLFKANIEPFEMLFLELGARVLKNAQNYISASPEKSVQAMRKELTQTIKSFEGSTDVGQIAKVATHMKKLEKLGGLDAIIPSEGIVFKYKGNTYKLTAAFAPLNQVLGIIKYGK